MNSNRWFFAILAIMVIVLSACAGNGMATEETQTASTAVGQDGTATAVWLLSDQDMDGLSNAQENALGTDVTNPDTDGDGLLDGDEIIWGSNPNVTDTDNDTIPDGKEVHETGTSPTNEDSDGDGLLDSVDPNPGALPTPTHLAAGTPAPPSPTIPEKRQVEVEWPGRIRKGSTEFVRLSLQMAPTVGGTSTPSLLRTDTPEPEYKRSIVAQASVENLYETHNIFAIARIRSTGFGIDQEESKPLSPGENIDFIWELPRAVDAGDYRVTLSLKLRYEPKQGGDSYETTLMGGDRLLTIKVTTVFGLTGHMAQIFGGLGSLIGSFLAFPLVEEIVGKVVRWVIKKGRDRDDEDGRKPSVTKAPVKILFLAASPSDTTPLRLDEEIRAIDQALRQAEFQDNFEIEQQWAVRVSELQDHLLRYSPEIVHFSGHGSVASEILLEDAGGFSQPVSPRALSHLFRTLKGNIRCVVLNACYSDAQAQAIGEHIDCVVGMSKAIGDEAAISFAEAFYRALGYGRDIKTAFDLGVGQIDLEGLEEKDTPRLLAGNKRPEEVVFVEAP